MLAGTHPLSICLALLFILPMGNSSYNHSSRIQLRRFDLVYVDGSLVSLASVGADSTLTCVSFCQSLASCTVVRFDPSSGNCTSLARNNNELGWVNTGGIKVYQDSTRPSKSVGPVTGS